MTEKKELPDMNAAKGKNGVDFNRFIEDFGEVLDQARAGHYSVPDIGQLNAGQGDVSGLAEAAEGLSGNQRLVWFVIDDAKDEGQAN